MNSTTPNTLGRALRQFSPDHLPRVRGQVHKPSRATVKRSVLLLRFVGSTTTDVGNQVGPRGPRPPSGAGFPPLP